MYSESNPPISTVASFESEIKQRFVTPRGGLDTEAFDVHDSFTTEEKDLLYSKSSENSNTTVVGADLDPLTLEYIKARLDLRDRRAARRARQSRIHESLEDTRKKILSANLERKRKLPTWVACIIRRIFVESGYIRNSMGAVLVFFVIFLMSAGIGFLAYTYWIGP